MLEPKQTPPLNLDLPIEVFSHAPERYALAAFYFASTAFAAMDGGAFLPDNTVYAYRQYIGTVEHIRAAGNEVFVLSLSEARKTFCCPLECASDLH